MRLGLGISIPGTSGLVQPAFSPLDLSPVLWLDAADTSTITEVGGAVSQWDDKSGNGNDLTQAQAVYQPVTGTRTLNSLNVLDFASDYVEIASLVISQPFTVFCVAETDGASEYTVYDFGAAGVATLFNIRNSVGDYRVLSGAVLQGGTSDNDPHVFFIVHNSTSSLLDVDGVSVLSGNAGTNAATKMRLGVSGGGGNFLDGAIAEVIVVAGTLSAGEIADTEQYLANKWGITL